MKKKTYLGLYCTIVMLSKDAICASEVGEGWRESWNNHGDSGAN